MDQPQYTTLVEVLEAIPDPRHARGKRYPWLFLLSLIALAMLNDQHTVHAIADWIKLHFAELQRELKALGLSCPSESTLRRTLRLIPIALLERLLSGLAISGSSPAPATTWEGQAIDGKELRGVGAHGAKLHLVSRVQHATGVVLGQIAVAHKSNEITAAPQLIAGVKLHGIVITVDALLTQRRFARQIRAQHGHYLMVVKANQLEVYESIALLFACPPWTEQEKGGEYDRHQTVNGGHGRLETRILESSTALNGYLDWPGLAQVLRRSCRRVNRQTGVSTAEIRYGITSLAPAQASAETLEALWRGHWTIENRVHRVRDVTMGEDAGQLRKGNAPHVLAALRNALLNLMRHKGWHNIADALRFYSSSLKLACDLIGLVPMRL